MQDRPDDTTSTVAEVAFEQDGERLLVVVDGDLSGDGTVADALTDIVVTAPERRMAETRIRALGEALGWEVNVDSQPNTDVVTLTPTSDDALVD